jgi:hypothetical protein
MSLLNPKTTVGKVSMEDFKTICTRYLESKDIEDYSLDVYDISDIRRITIKLKGKHYEHLMTTICDRDVRTLKDYISKE